MRHFLLFFSMVVATNFANAESVFIYGEGFNIGVKIPKGWDCSCDGKEAAEIGANAVLFKKGQNWRKAESIIFIRVNPAIDDKISEDMAADMKNYKVQHPDTKFKDLSIAHPKYKTTSKLFVKPKVSSEYVTYIAPKPFPKKNISSAMNIQKREANVDEIQAYKEITASLIWLGAKN